MSKTNLFFSTSFILVAFVGLSQTPPINDTSNSIYKTPNASIDGDVRINKLEKRYIEINSEDRKMNGYRIQLFSSPGPESFTKANEVQTEFLKIYPDIDAYVIHVGASFKLRIGDYRSRMEAERFYVELRENFSDAFIVRDRINFPVLEIEKEED
ncbi:MAG: SPOR domain-containing protein [Salibacteraceae bacterium]